jgi:hypothetical protein
VPDGASPAQIQAAREKAQQVRAEIDAGLDFAAAAIRYSEGQQALEGGDLGWRRYIGDGSVRPYASAPVATTSNVSSDLVMTLGFKF